MAQPIRGGSPDAQAPLHQRVAGRVLDHPWVTSVGLLVGVLAHGLLSWPFGWLSPYKNAQLTDDPDTTAAAVTIAIGLTGAAAILAGLTGVILVFTIGSSSVRLRGFRTSAGEPLRRTWIAVVAEPLLAAGLGVVSAVTQTTSGRIVAPFLMEAGCVLLVHTGARLVWLLNELVRIVAADDAAASESDRTHSVRSLLG